MFPRWHILFGAVFSLVLYSIFSFSAAETAIVLLSSVLIDVDHYIYYIHRKKDFSLRNAFNWFVNIDRKYYSLTKEKQKKYWYAFCIFHSMELVFILTLLSFFPKLAFLFFISIGFLFHLALDFFFKMSRDNDPLDILSLIYKSIKIKKQINFEKFVG